MVVLEREALKLQKAVATFLLCHSDKGLLSLEKAVFKNCAAVDQRRINGAYEFILDTCGRFSQGAASASTTAPHALIAEAHILLSVAQNELRDGVLVQGLLSVRCWLQEMSAFLMEVRYSRPPSAAMRRAHHRHR